MRLYQFHSKTRLDEMNLANGDAIQKEIATVFQHEAKARGARLAEPLVKLLLKRLFKAVQNDEPGHMVSAEPLTELPENAPAWMRTAAQRGETIVTVQLKPAFYHKLPHIIDWLMADTGAQNAVRTVPESDIMTGLTAAADKYFALSASRYRDMTPIEVEPGREVVLTFRAKGDEPPQMFEDKTLTPNEHGKVVMFWAKLTNDAALAREGSLMGHCVGGDNYVRAVKHDSATIFSLRDAANKPHVTIEAKGATGDWTINQVKGKGNKTPVAKYAPFVKAFLNEVGASANQGGRSDIRGIGLFHSNGRYGSPEEVGSKVGTTFKNGDTLRIYKEDSEKPSARRALGGSELELSYMSKDGTHPLSIKLSGEFQGEHMVNANLAGVSFFRDDPPKNASVAKNLAEYLNSTSVSANSRALEKIGVFYNAKTKIWGKLEDAAENVWQGFGLTAYSLRIDKKANNYDDTVTTTYETVFSDKSQSPVFVMISIKQPGKTNWYPTKIKQINESEIGGRLTEILVSFLNGVKATLPARDEAKDLLRDMGVATNRQGQWVTPSELKPIYTNKLGSVRVSGAYLYVLDKDGTTILGTRTKNKTLTAGYRNSEDYGYTNDLRWIDKSKAQAGTEILFGFSQANPEWKFDEFSDRPFIERGYVDRNNRLVSVAELSKTHKIRGHNLIAEVTPSGTTYRLEIGSNVLTIDTDENKAMTRIGYKDTTPIEVEPDENDEEEGVDQDELMDRYHRNRERKELRRLGQREADESILRPYIPLIMKATGIVCKRSQLIKFGLKEVNGKAVALDSKKDADLIGYFKGKMELGHDLEWTRNSRHTPDYSYNGGTTRKHHHLPTISGEITHKKTWRTLISIDANDPQKNEENDKWTPEFSYQDPSIKMVRNIPENAGITREQLYKIATAFLKFYHDKVMPMEENDQEMVGA